MSEIEEVFNHKFNRANLKSRLDFSGFHVDDYDDGQGRDDSPGKAF